MPITESGMINTLKVEFSSQSSILTHAKRLMTPRIPERVVCFSTENDITIGTHVGNMWIYRKLQIQDSPIQVNMHGTHDLSKYNPPVYSSSTRYGCQITDAAQQHGSIIQFSFKNGETKTKNFGKPYCCCC